MLLEESKETTMGAKEITFNFKCDEQYSNWLCREVGKTEMNRSEFMRTGITMYATMLSICPELSSVIPERLQRNPDFVRKILVLLEEV